MVNKTQEELEQPAKVYQLNAVENKVDNALVKLDTLINQTSGLVTKAQMDAAIKEEVDKIHLEYRPLKNNLTKFVWLLVASVLGIIAQAVIIYVIATGK